jgi:hypothetical protein
VPQKARLGCRLQELPGGLAGAFAKRSLTKRSRELRTHNTYKLCRSCLPGTRVNEAATACCTGQGEAHPIFFLNLGHGGNPIARSLASLSTS